MKKLTLTSFTSSQSMTCAVWMLTKLQQLIAIILAMFTIPVIIISAVIIVIVCDPYERLWRKKL